MAATSSQGAAGGTAEASWIATADGLRLACWHYRLAGCRARVVVVHGFGEHSGRYREVVETLLGAGCECHLFDLRGHGRSEGPRGHTPDFAAYHDDLARFAAQALGAGGTPVLLLAHSLGGLIALSALLHRELPFAGAVISSPFLAAAFAVSPLTRAALGLAGRLLPRWRLRAGIDAEGLSADPAVVEAYRADPLLVHHVTLAWGRSCLAAQEDVAARGGEISLPCLFLLGGADPIADPRQGRTVFERLGSADKRLVVYEGFRHEVLNELGKERVFADVTSWLSTQTSTPPPAR